MTQPIPPPDYKPPPIQIKLKYIAVEAILPGRLLTLPDVAGMDSVRATYNVSLEDWSCEGRVNGLVLANEDWWIEHCQQISKMVREQVTLSQP